MLGNVVLLGLSWLLLRLEGRGLSELGFNRPKLRLLQLVIGFAVAGAAAAFQQFCFALAAGTGWIFNPAFTGELLLDNLRWNTNSVVFEELIFRGYLLYLAIRLLGRKRAVLLGAAAFGVYHWFSFGAFGNRVAMIYVFVMTGMFGWMFATAFAQTKSLALPVGLHLGWNMATNLLFSAGPLGPAILVLENGAARPQVEGAAWLTLTILLPMALVASVAFFLSRNKRQHTIKSLRPAASK